MLYVPYRCEMILIVRTVPLMDFLIISPQGNFKDLFRSIEDYEKTLAV